MRQQAYKYRIYPNLEQQELISKHFGSCRFIYNWALDYKVKIYEQIGKNISCFDLINNLPQLKKDHEWLKEVDSQCLQMSLRNLDNAFLKFFKKQAGFPKFKSRKNHNQSCQFPQRVKVDFENKTIYLPKIGYIRLKLRKLTRRFEGKIKTVTLRQTVSGKYFVSILVERDIENPIPRKIKKETTVGIDVGIKVFATLSNGEEVEHPKTLKKLLHKLKFLQRRVSRKKKGSNNREKARKKLAKLHEHIANKRKDFLHKLSHRLVNDNQIETIAMEDLSIQEMLKNHQLAQSISDSGWGIFDTFIAYKCLWNGKNHVHIGRFDASSKICSICGWIKTDLTLKDREWVCGGCGTLRLRDLNASENIRNFAIHPQNLIHD